MPRLHARPELIPSEGFGLHHVKVGTHYLEYMLYLYAPIEMIPQALAKADGMHVPEARSSAYQGCACLPQAKRARSSKSLALFGCILSQAQWNLQYMFQANQRQRAALRTVSAAQAGA